MMKYLKCTCIICGDVKYGEFKDSQHICNRHRQDEVDFRMSLPAGKLTKDQKAQKRLYEQRWKP